MPVVINGDTGITQSGEFDSDSTFGFKNRIINGAMVIDQRNAGASVTTSSGTTVYTLDRWEAAYAATSKFTVQQNAGSVTPPTGFANYLGVTSSSAYSVTSTDYFFVRQKIEGFNAADLAWGTASAATVTLSFWVRSSLTGTFGGALRNVNYDRSYPFTFVINSANTWEQKTVTIAGPTSGTWNTGNSIGIDLAFSLGMGSTLSGTAGAWASANYVSATGATSVVGTNGATFYVTGVQLEKGSTATSFDFRDYGREQILCYRYYYQDSGGGGSIGFQYHASPGDINTHYIYKYPVTMRATPTVTVTVSNATAGSQYVGLNSCETYSTAPGTSGESRLNSIILSSEL